ncbi:hypothetical protein [Microbispora bryophytorum]|uniref:hypothetical protein n=1 Tax=Microbispora bryophytorum TaxID=1460882 RepID=UPI0033CBB834
MERNEATQGQAIDDNDHINSLVEELTKNNDARIRLAQVCEESEIPYAWKFYGDLDMIIELPNGRNRRERIVTSNIAERFLAANIATIKALGSYDAYYFSDEKVIETSIGTIRGPGRRLLQRLPGVEIEPPSSTASEAAAEDSPEAVLEGRKKRWRLSLQSEEGTKWGATIGTPSERFHNISDRNLVDTISLRLSGIVGERHDNLLSTLQRVANAVLFELDVNFGIAMQLLPSWYVSFSENQKRRRPPTQAANRVRLPQSQYEDKPLKLYWHASSAYGMPLLQFLAYYQVLEYYFPRYSKREALDRLRHELRDPSFDREEDGHLARILALAEQYGGGYGSEREQLQSTIKACVTEDRLREFITADESRIKHFSSSAIKDVAIFHANDQQNDPRNQAANRIYDLRCRVVHTKDEGAKKAADLLLPYSREADSLGPDIELVQFLAQRALIAGASRLRLEAV